MINGDNSKILKIVDKNRNQESKDIKKSDGIIIKAQLATARAPLRIGSVHLFVFPAVCLLPKCVHKNTHFFQKQINLKVLKVFFGHDAAVNCPISVKFCPGKQFFT